MKWSQLVERLKTTTRTKETVEQYLDFSKDDQTEIKDVGGYVVGRLEGGKRSNRTIIDRGAIVLDADFAPLDCWGWFREEFTWAACLHSTHKHRPESPKFRLIIPLSRPVNPEEYEAIGRKIAERYGQMDWFDDTTFQASRMMFWPSTSIDGQYVFESQAGPIIDPDKVLALYGSEFKRQLPYSSRVPDHAKGGPCASDPQNPLEKSGLVGAFCKTYSIIDAMEIFIPGVYKPTNDPNRWTYADGSSSGGLVIYDNLAYSNHSTDPAGGGHAVNAFDIVRIHKFGHLDKDAKGFGSALPSYKAMLDLCENDDLVKAAVANEMFSRVVEAQRDDKTGQSVEEFKKENRSWPSLLDVESKTGRIKSTATNVEIILEHDTKLAGIGGTNEFSGQPEKTGSLPWWEFDETEAEWTDADSAELALYIERTYGIQSDAKIRTARVAVWNRKKFHPVRDYLDGLQWDGCERLDRLLIDYLGAEDNEYVRAVTRKTFTAAVARIYEPGRKFDNVLTLAGPQGCGKSQIVRVMAGKDEWFNDSIQAFTGKESYEALQGAWFVELAELTANKRSEVEATKQFISKQSDKFRKAYGEMTTTYRRQCVFIGTTNTNDFLRDMTGNRRWWVVAVDGNGTKSVFTDLPLVRDQIFAEAKARYLADEPLYLDGKVAAMATKVQESHRFKSVFEADLENYLNMEFPEQWDNLSSSAKRAWLDFDDCSPKAPGMMIRDRVCLKEIWEVVCAGTAKMGTADQRLISDTLTKLGWKKLAVRPRWPVYGRQTTFERPEESVGRAADLADGQYWAA